MKTLKHLFLLIISAATVTSCQKQPVANFTFDKDIYYTGDTIHLKDASTDAKKWKWTSPDGQTFTSKDLDYVIDSGDVGGDVTLEATSRNQKLADEISKPYNVILPSDYFSVGSSVFIPNKKATEISGSHWVLNASHISSQGPYGMDNAYFHIYFSENSAPLEGIYLLQPSRNTIDSGYACISIDIGGVDADSDFRSFSGQVEVSISNDKKIHAVFSNVSIDSTSLTKMDGDITCKY